MTVLKEKLETVNSIGWITWLTLIIVCFSLYAYRPDLFSPEQLRQFFSANLFTGLVAYFLITTIRGITLVPLTPFLLAAILVFPPWHLFLVNQLSIVVATGLLYYTTSYMRFDKYFFTHHPEQAEKLLLLLHKRELPVITLWGFTPFVPTDMIVCVCSVLRISIWKTVLGIFLGEGMICAVYIFGGSLSVAALVNYFQ